MRTKNTEIRNRPLPKNLIDYAIFCIRTNNVQALLKGYFKLFKIYVNNYTRYILRCHPCRKKHSGPKIVLLEDTRRDKMKKFRSN